MTTGRGSRGGLPPDRHSDPTTDGVTPDEAWARARVTAVVREAVRESGAEGVALSIRGEVEGGVLGRWLREAGLTPVAEGPAEEVHSRAIRARALVASDRSKTALLLERPAALAHLHPLGDVWGSWIASWAGGARLPDPLPSVASHPGDIELLTRVDGTLRAWTERGVPLDEALARLPDEVRRRLEPVLRRPLPAGREPIVPKLTTWTPWTDPPL